MVLLCDMDKHDSIPGHTNLPFIGVPDALPAAETAYLDEVVNRLQNSLGSRLVGIYLFGSAGSGEYEPGISDLDVQAVVSESLSVLQREELARCLSHTGLPCPATRLDFICYSRSSIDPAHRHPHFELNFNTCGIFEQLMLEPVAEADHWLLLDIAIGRELGHALLGPPPGAIYAPIPRAWQLQAISEALAWHQMHDIASPNNVLNACRGWRYAVTGVFGSKVAGAAWALLQPGCPPVVERAEQSRRDGALLDPSEVTELNAIAGAAVRRALHETHAA